MHEGAAFHMGTTRKTNTLFLRAPVAIYNSVSALILSMMTTMDVVQQSKSLALRSFHKCQVTIMKRVEAPFFLLAG
jgi:hypothetical protein